MRNPFRAKTWFFRVLIFHNGTFICFRSLYFEELKTFVHKDCRHPGILCLRPTNERGNSVGADLKDGILCGNIEIFRRVSAYRLCVDEREIGVNINRTIQLQPLTQRPSLIRRLLFAKTKEANRDDRNQSTRTEDKNFRPSPHNPMLTWEIRSTKHEIQNESQLPAKRMECVRLAAAFRSRVQFSNNRLRFAQREVSLGRAISQKPICRRALFVGTDGVGIPGANSQRPSLPMLEVGGLHPQFPLLCSLQRRYAVDNSPTSHKFGRCLTPPASIQITSRKPSKSLRRTVLP